MEFPDRIKWAARSSEQKFRIEHNLGVETNPPPSPSPRGYSYKFNLSVDHENKKRCELELKFNRKYVLMSAVSQNLQVNFSFVECPVFILVIGQSGVQFGL